MESAAPRRDSRQAYDERERQEALERDLARRTDVVTGNGTIYDDKAKADADRAEQRAV